MRKKHAAIYFTSNRWSLHKTSPSRDTSLRVGKASAAKLVLDQSAMLQESGVISTQRRERYPYPTNKQQRQSYPLIYLEHGASVAARLATSLALEPRDEGLDGELLGQSTRGLAGTGGRRGGGNGLTGVAEAEGASLTGEAEAEADATEDAEGVPWEGVVGVEGVLPEAPKRAGPGMLYLIVGA
jgi:hypothetical protein